MRFCWAVCILFTWGWRILEVDGWLPGLYLRCAVSHCGCVQLNREERIILPGQSDCIRHFSYISTRLNGEDTNKIH
jgi:hypothetical protein